MRRRGSRLRGLPVNTIPNTFIGGMASAIPTKADLAIALNIPETTIGSFSIVGSNIEAAINDNYHLVRMWQITLWNPITYYRDNQGKIQSLLHRLEGKTFLSEVIFPEITSIPSYVFRSTVLVDVVFPKVTSLAGTGVFMNNSSLRTVDLPELLTITSGNTDGTFRLTGLTSLNIPKCTSIGSMAFYLIPVCTITCNAFLQTSNGGAENAEIAYARGRGCTIIYV